MYFLMLRVSCIALLNTSVLLCLVWALRCQEGFSREGDVDARQEGEERGVGMEWDGLIGEGGCFMQSASREGRCVRVVLFCDVLFQDLLVCCVFCCEGIAGMEREE